MGSAPLKTRVFLRYTKIQDLYLNHPQPVSLKSQKAMTYMP